jgi:PDZ domain-containing protein
MTARMRRPRHPFRIAGLIVVAGLLVASAWIRLPYYAVGPGPARNVLPFIMFSDQPRYEPAPGSALEMTTVRYYQVTPLQALAVRFFEPDWTLVSQDLLYPSGDVALENQRSISQMDQSKIDATWVVLRHLTDYPKDHGMGALVESTVPNCSADGRLFPGDVITAIDGETVHDTADVHRILDHAEPGRPLAFTLDVDGTAEHATFTRGPCGPHGKLLVGFSSLDAFPFPIQISSDDVGGPSAGLMWALGLYELMTPGDLVAGRHIAGTGTIDLRGRVGPIGGIQDKVVAAEKAGAQIFLAPSRNMPELEGVDTGGMQVISVATFADALRALAPSGTTT